MNIFVLDRNPKIAARYHCDKHVVKMILESTQLLSTAHHVLGDGGPYRKTHTNHPCAVWVRNNWHHYIWVRDLLVSLLAEYTDRYGKRHKCEDVLFQVFFPPTGMSASDPVDPPQCMPDEYKGDDVVDAYRSYYIGDKSRFATWKTSAPYWYVTETFDV